MRSISDLAKHSSIYGLGQIISRFASVLILPLYTHYLSPADYGVIAILDLTTMILAMMIGAGMSQAVTRYHFEAKSEDDRRFAPNEYDGCVFDCAPCDGDFFDCFCDFRSGRFETRSISEGES